MVSGLFSIPPQAPLCALTAAGGIRAPLPRRFLAGPENALLTRALAAVQTPCARTNPLVITGVSGSGKTLLLELLVDEFRRCFDGVAVLATTAVDLARAYAHAVQADSVGEFRQRYSRLHLLAIDDVQRVAEKQAAQQELQQLVDSLVGRGCLVLATLRTHPLDTPELSYPLASRLAAGLVVPLVPPAGAVRRTLIEHFAASVELEIRPAVLDALEAQAALRPRLATAPQLRRAVIGLGEMARQRGCPVDRDLVDEFLESDDANGKPALKAIAAAVSKHLDVSVADLRGKSRLRSLTTARGLAMHLARELTGASFIEIGRYFGNRDHTTVMHACKKAAAIVAAQPHVRQWIDRVSLRLAAEEVGP